ncbi:MAG: proline dehydrogenase family protein [Bacteroidia bacterium]|nr:proline dehydrogenase family protein [Bacteroidia bacterium]
MEDVAPRINFNNTELAFQAQTDAKLRRTYWLFRLIDSPFLTKVGPKLLNLGFKLRLPVKGLVKSTLFDLFAGGESLAETVKRSEHLMEYGVRTILDYSVEGEKTEEGFEKTKQEIIGTLVHGHKHEAVAFSACKLTGLASFDLMANIQAGKVLTKAEQEAFERVKNRVREIAMAARDYDVPVFFDAEETWIQDVIDGLVEGLMEEFNRDKVIVWTTTQHYRHDRLAYLQSLLKRSEERGYLLGVKLVRGAYLEKENRRAEEMGYPTPIQPNKAATDHDYNEALKLCIDHIDHVAVCAGTHNEQSSALLAELLQQKGLPANHPHVWFAQLLSMSDHISFNLGHGGYNAAKYLPYGPVKSVMPYLIRRAEENTSVAGQASREVELLKREVLRRN